MRPATCLDCLALMTEAARSETTAVTVGTPAVPNMVMKTAVITSHAHTSEVRHYGTRVVSQVLSSELHAPAALCHVGVIYITVSAHPVWC
jgi:hypothetical protein